MSDETTGNGVFETVDAAAAAKGQKERVYEILFGEKKCYVPGVSQDAGLAAWARAQGASANPAGRKPKEKKPTIATEIDAIVAEYKDSPAKSTQKLLAEVAAIKAAYTARTATEEVVS